MYNSAGIQRQWRTGWGLRGLRGMFGLCGLCGLWVPWEWSVRQTLSQHPALAQLNMRIQGLLGPPPPPPPASSDGLNSWHRRWSFRFESPSPDLA